MGDKTNQKAEKKRPLQIPEKNQENGEGMIFVIRK